jgi:ATP-dependent RNA helicase RhlE
VAISLCAPEEREFVRDIERLIRRSITVIGERPAASGTRKPSVSKPPAGNRPARSAGQPRSGGWTGRGTRGGGPGPRQGGGRGAGRNGHAAWRAPSHEERGPALLQVPARQESEQKLDTFGAGI